MSRLTGALCANEDPHTFQSTHQSDHEEAAAICARCPVRVACLELARRHSRPPHPSASSTASRAHGAACSTAQPRRSDDHGR
jgi:hypothetical protein